MEKDRQQLTEYFKGVDTEFSTEDSLLLRQQLQSAQQQLERITELLGSGRKVLDIVDRNDKTTVWKR
jgi:5-bromo-4-chloroindolyl phosphate hydrolysis protein